MVFFFDFRRNMAFSPFFNCWSASGAVDVTVSARGARRTGTALTNTRHLDGRNEAMEYLQR